MADSISNLQRQIIEKRSQLKTLQEKYDLNNKKIKLFRKQNQDLRSSNEKQSHTDTTLLLNSKELSDANSKLQSTIEELQNKLNQPLESIGNIADVVTLADVKIDGESEQVDLTGKGIKDEEILEIKTFIKIQSLILDNNPITDASLSVLLESLKNLKKLLLNSCQMTVLSIASLPSLTGLKVLQLNSNNLTDKIMPFICQIPHLKQLSISKNEITDKGVEEFGGFDGKQVKLISLVYLDIMKNSITDASMKILQKLENLTHLYAGWNKIGVEGIRRIIGMNTLVCLDARMNLLSTQQRESVKSNCRQKLQLFC